MDLQVCLDFFAVITYITEYYTKDDTSTMKFLKDALKGSEVETLKEKMILIMNTFMSVRQMGEAEAYYRILPELHLKDSNCTTVYVPNCKKAERSKFLKQVQNDSINHNQAILEVEDRPGKYIEIYDMVDKWYRRPRTDELIDLSFTQFAKMFRSSWTVTENVEKIESESESENETDNTDMNLISEENKFHFTMTAGENDSPKELPKSFRLTSSNPGEPPFMKKRSFPAILRFHKYKEENKPHNYYFSELLLYYPHFHESEIFPDDETACKNLYLEKQQQILAVKSQVMEHLQGVDEARYFVEQAIADKAGLLLLHFLGQDEDPLNNRVSSRI